MAMQERANGRLPPQRNLISVLVAEPISSSQSYFLAFIALIVASVRSFAP